MIVTFEHDSVGSYKGAIAQYLQQGVSLSPFDDVVQRVFGFAAADGTKHTIHLHAVLAAPREERDLFNTEASRKKLLAGG